MTFSNLSVDPYRVAASDIFPQVMILPIYMTSIDLESPWNYASAANDGAVSVMAVQTHTRVTVSIATNARGDTVPRCRHIVLFPSSTLHPGGKPPYLLSSLQWCKSSVNDRWHLPTYWCPCLSPSCHFWRHPWSEVASSPYRRIFGILLLPIFFPSVRWRWNALSRVLAWAGFYERSVVPDVKHK